MAKFLKKFDCIQFCFAELTRKKVDGQLFYCLFLDGDYFYSRSYPGIMQIFMEVITRDCLPKK